MELELIMAKKMQSILLKSQNAFVGIIRQVEEDGGDELEIVNNPEWIN